MQVPPTMLLYLHESHYSNIFATKQTTTFPITICLVVQYLQKKNVFSA